MADADLERVIRIHGQDRSMAISEIAIDGQVRGALSHALSRVLRGEADTNGDARVSVPELKRFLERNVERRTEFMQAPEVVSGSDNLSIDLTGRVPKRPTSPEMPDLRIFFADGLSFDKLAGITEVHERQLADLAYFGADRELVYKTGDLVAKFSPDDSDKELVSKLQGAIDKWRLLELLDSLETSDDPEIRLSEGNRLYRDGEIATFEVLSAIDRFALVFNLAHDGTMQFLARSGGQELERFGIRLRAGRPLKLKARAGEPFGADHLVAITTANASEELADLASVTDGNRNGEEFARRLIQVLDGMEFGLGRVGLFTRAMGDDA